MTPGICVKYAIINLVDLVLRIQNWLLMLKKIEIFKNGNVYALSFIQ